MIYVYMHKSNTCTSYNQIFLAKNYLKSIIFYSHISKVIDVYAFKFFIIIALAFWALWFGRA